MSKVKMISADSTDKELVAAAREGDRRAFKVLVEKHERLVAGTVIGMLGPGQEAEDTGQETFIRFYKALDNFRGESKIGTYLVRIAINLSLNQIKRRKRNSLFFLGNSEGILENLGDERDSQENRIEREGVRKAVLQLKPDYRAVVVLRYLEGYSTEETARILGVPLGTVLSRLSRAQKKLRDLIKTTMGVAYA